MVIDNLHADQTPESSPTTSFTGATGRQDLEGTRNKRKAQAQTQVAREQPHRHFQRNVSKTKLTYVQHHLPVTNVVNENVIRRLNFVSLAKRRHATGWAIIQLIINPLSNSRLLLQHHHRCKSSFMLNTSGTEPSRARDFGKSLSTHELQIDNQHQNQQFQQKALRPMTTEQQAPTSTHTDSTTVRSQKLVPVKTLPPTKEHPGRPKSIPADRQNLLARMLRLPEELCKAVEKDSLIRVEALRGVLETLRATHEPRPVGRRNRVNTSVGQNGRRIGTKSVISVIY
ncbi:hypothetical protein SARC_04369 [Sphaeroforma arctica JP610]|uniref:Uncharacterized protein n=1 Tax=Sphaeroforma arctica JP610 TaxID=667725 RepID=A0A0L0G2L8_9EUKA|nr:hypothetical protein SARC_04369 [Sphaeroforma arctica JP610]KNC83382.1 hypothetical protein SARC_04369 [Sphaeroforma arctica JP610]|eukprot:XP_014157284.1 hypothetical protein SARC_04369 [Sphaeroforma arctica JP610]